MEKYVLRHENPVGAEMGKGDRSSLAVLAEWEAVRDSCVFQTRYSSWPAALGKSLWEIIVIIMICRH